MPFWKKPEFKELQKEWYRRLHEEGFEDIEKVSGDELVLKQTSSYAYEAYGGTDPVTRDSKEAYFHFVAQKIQETVFTRDVDRIILTHHAEGKKIRHICEHLEAIGKRRCRGTIRFRIRVYEVKWGIRRYTPKQLNQACRPTG